MIKHIKTEIPSINRIKKLPSYTITNLNEINKGRVLVGLRRIEVKIRTCLICGQKFESIGARTCGCKKLVDSAQLNGREVVYEGCSTGTDY